MTDMFWGSQNLSIGLSVFSFLFLRIFEGGLFNGLRSRVLVLLTVACFQGYDYVAKVGMKDVFSW